MKSIRAQLIALAVAVLLPLLALAAWNGLQHYRHQIQQAQGRVVQLAEAVAGATAELLALSERSLESTAGMMARRLAPDGSLPTDTCRALLEPVAAALPHFSRVTYVTAGGSPVCSAGPASATAAGSAPDPGWVQDAVESGGFVISEPQRDLRAGAWAVVLAHPVAAGVGGRGGLVTGSMALEGFQDLLPDGIADGGTLMTIADDHFHVVARSEGFDEWAGRLLPPVDADERPVAPGRAITRAEDLRGVPRTFARVAVPRYGWYVYAGLPDAVVYPPARARAVRDVAIALSVLLLALLLAWAVYRRIRGSLAALVEGVEDSALRDEPLPEEGPEEVRAVAAALNQTRAARALARSILDNAVFGIYVSNGRGELLEVNPALAHMLGYDDPDELREAGVLALYPDPRRREELVGSALEDGRIRNQELEWRGKDGRTVTVRLNGKIIEGPEGEPLFEMIVEDITRQKALEEEVRQTQKMEAVGRLAGGVAHDFNNVLTAILGHATLLRTVIDQDHPAVESVEEIVASAQRASSLTRQLLSFSRGGVVAARRLDVSEVIADMQRMIAPLIGEEVELVTRLDPDLPHVETDPGHLEQVVLNLVVNARDALPHGGRIEVSTWSEPDGKGGAPGRVVLEVRDTGVGMSEDVKKRIFEPFYTTKPEGVGTGLGLSTVYGIVTQNGGQVTVESELGKGSTFRLTLPGHPREEGVPEAELPSPAPRPGGVILVAEDEDGVRAVLRRVLEGEGFRVMAARSGSEAVALAADHGGPVDLLVTDVVMPGLGGLETADMVAELHPEAAVLFMSGYTESGALRERTRDDPASFLSKPFQPEELLQRVRELLDDRAAASPP